MVGNMRTIAAPDLRLTQDKRCNCPALLSNASVTVPAAVSQALSAILSLQRILLILWLAGDVTQPWHKFCHRKDV